MSERQSTLRPHQTSHASPPTLVLVLELEAAPRLYAIGAVGDQAIERVAVSLAGGSPVRLRLLEAIVDALREADAEASS